MIEWTDIQDIEADIGDEYVLKFATGQKRLAVYEGEGFFATERSTSGTCFGIVADSGLIESAILLPK